MAQVTRAEVIAKWETLPGPMRTRRMESYIVMVVPSGSEEPPFYVSVQDAARDCMFMQTAADTEPSTYVPGAWEALILAP